MSTFQSSTTTLAQPDYMYKFRASAAKPLIAEVLRTELSDKKYEAEDMAELTKTIGEQINLRLSKESGMERYKFISNVNIFQNSGQGARMGSSAVWDREADCVVQETYVSESLKCVAVVFVVLVY
ncbi:Tctex1 domain-containing protein 2 [Linderina macrospora]|uniref:Tctex1 domain-containing protein 2 n=1 Tax=Linderina macrospora TaxID=4868 RepID=A0ACC1J823_9FUNG|nr:Tctex1 domain-containing protein 2 [Linderina macrospora]